MEGEPTSRAPTMRTLRDSPNTHRRFTESARRRPGRPRRRRDARTPRDTRQRTPRRRTADAPPQRKARRPHSGPVRARTGPSWATPSGGFLPARARGDAPPVVGRAEQRGPPPGQGAASAAVVGPLPSATAFGGQPRPPRRRSGLQGRPKTVSSGPPENEGAQQRRPRTAAALAAALSGAGHAGGRCARRRRRQPGGSPAPPTGRRLARGPGARLGRYPALGPGRMTGHLHRDGVTPVRPDDGTVTASGGPACRRPKAPPHRRTPSGVGVVGAGAWGERRR